MSRKGLSSLLPSAMTQIIPVWSTTNKRPLPSGGATNSTGEVNPLAMSWSPTRGEVFARMPHAPRTNERRIITLEAFILPLSYHSAELSETLVPLQFQMYNENTLYK